MTKKLKLKLKKIMDNPNFGSSHLSSPALVVFSQAANGLSDALRLQRPFHSQLQDAKDLHHLSLVSSYGTHLLHGFQPHFLHQHLNPAVSSANSSPFGSGGAFVKPFPTNLSLPSAFAPPKCLGFGLDQVSIWALPSRSKGESTWLIKVLQIQGLAFRLWKRLFIGHWWHG